MSITASTTRATSHSHDHHDSFEETYQRLKRQLDEFREQIAQSLEKNRRVQSELNSLNERVVKLLPGGGASHSPSSSSSRFSLSSAISSLSGKDSSRRSSVSSDQSISSQSSSTTTPFVSPSTPTPKSSNNELGPTATSPSVKSPNGTVMNNQKPASEYAEKHQLSIDSSNNASTSSSSSSSKSNPSSQQPSPVATPISIHAPSLQTQQQNNIIPQVSTVPTTTENVKPNKPKAVSQGIASRMAALNNANVGMFGAPKPMAMGGVARSTSLSSDQKQIDTSSVSDASSRKVSPDGFRHERIKHQSLGSFDLKRPKQTGKKPPAKDISHLLDSLDTLDAQ